MEKKWWFLIIVLIVMVIAGISLIRLMKPTYSDPKDWIEQKPDGTKIINLTKATDGASYIDSAGGQQWNDKYVNTAFDYGGLYSGEYFNRYYVNESGFKLMEITPNLKPNNNIIEGIIIEKIIKGDEVTTYIFLDEDWKQKVKGTTNIVWGERYENFREFDFTEISKGIYMDSVKDVKTRFKEDFYFHLGSVMVGNFSYKHVNDKDNTEGLTVIRLI